MPDRVAIVSFAARLPGSGPDLDRFWADVAAAADCSREVPAGRWVLPPDRCLDPRVAHPDTVYSARGYYLDPFDPDLTGLDLDPGLVAELDPLFHLVLDVGSRAWRGAKTDAVDRARVGVVLGNICLPTDKANALCREVLGGAAGRTHPLNRYVAGLPAGLLAKGLGLGGGSFTLDAACASSLYALKLAADDLLAGRLDAVLAGGCSRPDCQYTQMGFSQLRALSPSGRCSPFSAAADGLMVGEGAGVFVLKRLSDALAHGDTILGVIAGVGVSNDLRGNLLAPAKEGQLRAMRAAYAKAGWRPQDVDLVECHATGTPVGDAVEFDSLRELWGGSGWEPGRCPIGSVKSTVGHLLTGAGAAAVGKVLLAMRAGLLPPQANFAGPADGLRYAGGPFRVLAEPEPWGRRAGGGPRRAAVSGFGFGGVNAHFLIEEWTGGPAAETSYPEPRREAVPVAVVGVGAHFGRWGDLRKFQEHVFAADPAAPAPKANGWGQAAGPCPPAFGVEEVGVAAARFRTPPKEVAETLPQQLLMLNVAAAALDDCRGAAAAGEDPTTGVFVGLGLDPNTTNFHLRWSGAGASPPLTANRTMGALGSIAASRVARAFHFGGPSHTVCSEEGSAARAVELGVRALRAGELDRVVVGGVDLACDPRAVLPGGVAVPGEGAAAFVLKRLADAERDGDRVYAVVTGVGVAADAATAAARAGAADGAVRFDAAADVGEAGAASAAASLAKACVALRQEILPPSGGREPPVAPAPQGAHAPRSGGARYWLHDREAGPRRAVVEAAGADGTHYAIALEEHAGNAAGADPERRQPLGARAEAVFAVDGDSPADLLAGLDRLREFAARHPDRNIEAVAREWFRTSPPAPDRRLAVALVARSADELAEQVAFAAGHLRANPDEPLPASARPAVRDRVFYAPRPLGPAAKVALVFPGSGNQFDGMGRDLSAQWPEVLRRQQAESGLLRGQFAPEHFWDGAAGAAPPRDLMFGQVTVGALVSDILLSLGVRCDAMVGLSLGESAGLFGVRAWRGRDEMFRRMQRSTLFASDLAPPYDAARAHFGQAVDWVVGVVAAGPDAVRAALRPGRRAYLLIVNTPGECVVGGARADVAELAAVLGKPITPLTGVTLAHCEAGRPVEEPYRELHTLPVTAPPGVTVYSGAWGRAYEPTEADCAASITAGLVGPIDVPAVVEAAYRDGVRAFVEVGPGSSCTRVVGAILGDRPHLARAAHAARQDAVSQVLRLVAHLAAERLPVDLAALYGGASPCVGHREPAAAGRDVVVVPVGAPGALLRSVANRDGAAPGAVDTALSLVPVIEAAANVRVLNMQAQEAFLRVSQRLTESVAGVVRFQTRLLAAGATVGEALLPRAPGEAGVPRPRDGVPRSLTFEQCCTFAAGRIADVLGPRFAEIDAFPTRVRLPDGPLQLVDRVTLIEGEPLSLTRGRVVTEHAVRPDRWYLDAGRIPTAIAVEAGQADLFLSGYLGIDLRTRGLAVYRLLDAVVRFHRGLPAAGEAVVYDIRIDEFTQQGDAWLFRFRFDGTVDGEPFITMRNGVAGFFTAEALAAGKGIVQTALDKKPMPGKRPADWRDLAPPRPCSLSAEQVTALRAGDLAAAFGPDFAGLPLRAPATLPGGMLRLVDRVPVIDPAGGRFGLGYVRAEFDIRPDDWFLTCHFVDDRVMPGTLMYECCLHTLRVLLMRLGWVGEAGEVACEPVPGVDSRLKCRGQVVETTRTVTYEVTVKELGYGPAPYCLADALMSADGRPIVEITNMSLRMSGLTRDALERTWLSGGRQPPVPPAAQGADAPRSGRVYGSASILAFSNGNPSEAFGPPYRVFDRDRVIARLPGPPFQFLDRVTPTAGEPFVMKAGAACRAEYEVPADAWYFAAERSGAMPFAVLLEVALQPCGWLAAYCGSALTSPDDLSFRNLGGKGTQFRRVTPDTGTLTTVVKLTGVSHSAGMVIQHYDMQVRDRAGPVYAGTTYFGFFTKAALRDQVGIRDAPVPWPTPAEVARAETAVLPHDAPFPAPMLRMVDRVTYVPDGGRAGLGLVVGTIAVDPDFWFFKAHFHQDPVWPGSLGLESFLQLLKYAAWRRWGTAPAVALGRPHAWTYRGQVLPADREVTVVLEVTAADDAARRLTAAGFLTVDGRVIYQMTDFALD
jgi:acyl transferase domain-containing protein/3-hydroxymyristoyl/3-hydroxydecanoyl-(acyl carrier protein) dehydratase